MSNLIPTVITDVNGKVTTVHRKQQSGARKTASVPAPKTKTVWPPIRQDAEVLGELVKALGLRIQHLNPKVRDNIVSLSDEDVEFLKTVLASPPPRVMQPEEFQAAMVYPMNTNDGDAGRHMRNSIVLLESELPVYRHQPLLATLGKHKAFKEAAYDLYSADDESKKLICGVANAIHSLRRQENVVQNKYGTESVEPLISTTGKYLRMTDKALLAAILDHPDHAEAIAALYIDRGNIDALDEVLNTSSAIRDGAL